MTILHQEITLKLNIYEFSDRRSLVLQIDNQIINLMKIDPERFLELSENLPVIDVRSPAEYKAGHIPDAVNIPLFNDNERVAVGTKYKKEGRIPAIIEGLKQTGPVMFLKLEEALKHCCKTTNFLFIAGGEE